MEERPDSHGKLTDEERQQRQLRDPEVKERLREIREMIDQGSSGPGINAVELPDFLRGQRR